MSLFLFLRCLFWRCLHACHRDPNEYVLLEVLAELVEQPFYNSLRTQQQLGYIVYSGIKVCDR